MIGKVKSRSRLKYRFSVRCRSLNSSLWIKFLLFLTASLAFFSSSFSFLLLYFLLLYHVPFP